MRKFSSMVYKIKNFLKKYSLCFLLGTISIIIVSLHGGFDAILAWGTLAAVAVAFFAAITTNSRMRSALNADLLARLDERFNNDEMKRKRKLAADSILNSRYNSDVAGVLDFFSLIGILVRHGALDKEMTWRMFFSEFHPYYLKLKLNYIDKERIKDPRIYESVEALHSELLLFESRLFLDSWNDNKLNEFFTEENK